MGRLLIITVGRLLISTVGRLLIITVGRLLIIAVGRLLIITVGRLPEHNFDSCLQKISANHPEKGLQKSYENILGTRDE